MSLPTSGQKFHIGENGEPGKCTAKKVSCPFGGPSEHFDTQLDAQKEAERRFNKEFGGNFSEPFKTRDDKDLLDQALKGSQLARTSTNAKFIAHQKEALQTSLSYAQEKKAKIDRLLEEMDDDTYPHLNSESLELFHEVVADEMEESGKSLKHDMTPLDFIEAHKKRYDDYEARLNERAEKLEDRLENRVNTKPLETINKRELNLLKKTSQPHYDNTENADMKWDALGQGVSSRDRILHAMGAGHFNMRLTKDSRPNSVLVSHDEINELVKTAEDKKASAQAFKMSGKHAHQAVANLRAKFHEPKYVSVGLETTVPADKANELYYTARYNQLQEYLDRPQSQTDPTKRAKYERDQEKILFRWRKINPKRKTPNLWDKWIKGVPRL
ncbi:hypothetical protein [Nesterenkonia alba]|uniref:hypothetical protein n=1 Tax=Nesterenkonia alba TaxID=515814 RepID=UPI0003B4E00C|nr:hypothetical protein [Nesterenkonia alba]